MADRIGVMHEGRLLQWSTAQALYQTPLDPFVAGFIGRGTVIQATQLGIGGGGRVLVRPQSLLLDPAASLRARVEAVVFRGPGSSGWVRLAGGERLELDFGPGQLPEIGAEIGLVWHDPAPVRFAD